MTQREDKLVVVLNQYGQSKSIIENELKRLISADDEVKEAIGNIYMINFKESDNLKVRGYLNSLSQRSSMIKFVAPVYFGESMKVTQIAGDEFIVRLKNLEDKNKLDYLNARNDVQILGNVGGDKGFILKTLNGNPKSSMDLSNDYFETGLFEYAEPNFAYPDFCLLNADPNDSRYGSQWPLKNTGQTAVSWPFGGVVGDAGSYNGIAGSDMKVNLAWDYTTGSTSVEVAVFDTGIDSTHPDLRANVLTGYNAVNNVYGVPRDSGSHGTCTAGIIGAVRNNNLGVAGVAGNCKIRSYKIFKANGTTTNEICGRAFDTLRMNASVQISSNSWGGGTANATVTNAINSCATSGRGGIGVLILFSSGNDGKNPPAYPSYLASVVCIGASTASDQKKAPGTGNQYYWGGNYGEDVNGDLDCVAPTICPSPDIQGTGGYNDSAGVSGNYTQDFNGTSCSCPQAAGVAALVLSVNLSLTPAQIKDYLLRGCDKIDNLNYSTTKTYGKWNAYMGYGRVNAYNSVRLAAGVDVTPPTINHLFVESTSSTYPVSLTAEIIDQSGSAIDTSVYKPQVVYRTNKNNAGWSAFDSSVFTSKSGDNFTLKIPGFGWQTEVQYYIRAKDSQLNTALFPIHAPDTTNLCYYAVASITSETQKVPSFALPISGQAFSPNVSFTSFKILKSRVRMYVRHQANVTYLLNLNSPVTNTAFNRKSITTHNGPLLVSNVGIVNATAMDSASLFWRDGTEPWTNGFFKPDYAFNGLNGLNAGGNWNILYYTSYTSYSGTADSIFITLYKSSGTLSPSAGGSTTPSDSIATFSYSDTSSYNFYLKNNGNAALTISGASFSGTYASKFSLLTAVPPSIAAGDSALFRVKCNPAIPKPGKGNEMQSMTDDFENATLDITTNDPSKPTVRISLQTDDEPLPVELTSFTSSVNRNDVKLNWTTLTEINNSGFEIQRMNQRENSDWARAGFVQGNGNSTVVNNYSFEERNLATARYKYRLKQIDFNGNYAYHNLSNEVNVGIPDVFALQQNYPNPFNPSTTINFDLPLDARVKILIYDITGRQISTIIDNDFKAGYNFVKFNASSFASGVYFYSLTAGSGSQYFTATKRMVLVK